MVLKKWNSTLNALRFKCNASVMHHMVYIQMDEVTRATFLATTTTTVSTTIYHLSSREELASISRRQMQKSLQHVQQYD
jgi:hypothetical protein